MGWCVSQGVQGQWGSGSSYFSLMVCMDDGWFKQPNVTESDWTMGLGEAAHLLHNEESVRTC